VERRAGDEAPREHRAHVPDVPLESARQLGERLRAQVGVAPRIGQILLAAPADALPAR